VPDSRLPPQFSLFRKKKKKKAREFLPLRLLHCGFAAEGGDYGMRIRYDIVLLSHVSQVLVLSTSTPCECEGEKNHPVVLCILSFFACENHVSGRKERWDGGFDILAASICSSTAARHRWMKQEAPV